MEKGFTINVLDHGFVKYVNSMGEDKDIIEAARMSTNKGFQSWDKDIFLLDYLYRNKHTSPFEMLEVIVDMQAPIFCLREIMRHRVFSFNEASSRYSKMSNLHYVPSEDRIKKQSKKNNQGSSDEGFDEGFINKFIEEVMYEQELVYVEYSKNIDAGVAREIARINAPVSRYSKVRAKVDLRNMLHFLNLRMRENAQWETVQFANAIAVIVKELFPKSYELFEEYDLYAENISRTEMKVLKQLLLSSVNKEDYQKELEASGIKDPNRLNQCVDKFYK